MRKFAYQNLMYISFVEEKKKKKKKKKEKKNSFGTSCDLCLSQEDTVLYCGCGRQMICLSILFIYLNLATFFHFLLSFLFYLMEDFGFPTIWLRQIEDDPPSKCRMYTCLQI